MPADDALARLDAYLCDVKELQIRDGLHVFGQPPRRSGARRCCDGDPRRLPGADRRTLGRIPRCLGAGEAARRCWPRWTGVSSPPGPAGAPSRGRADVLPTGRNLYSLDPRAAPTRSAMVLARKTAEAIAAPPFAGPWRLAAQPGDRSMGQCGAAHRRRGSGAGASCSWVSRPVWDEGSARVSGIEILPLAVLDRPRVDVTLRISGLFRDAFETQMPAVRHGGARHRRAR